MFGSLLLAVVAATMASLTTLAAGGGFLAAAAVYCLVGSALVASWAGMAVLADRRPRLRRVRVALFRHQSPA